MAEKESPRSSKGVTRVKSGCITCRIRRVKCDEARPSCKRCTGTGDGYSTLPFSRRELQAAAIYSGDAEPAPNGIVARLVADQAFSDVLEKRYFQFFRQRTVDQTNCLIESRFWDRLVLSYAHAEPAIKHGVLALSALHQLYELVDEGEQKQQHLLYTDKQHQKALISLRMLVSTATAGDVDRILIACVIFIAYEGIRGNYQASRAHLLNGRAVLSEYKEAMQRSARRHDLAEIVRTLSRLDVPALTFQDRSVGPALTLDDFYSGEHAIEVPEFKSLADAQDSITQLLRWAFCADNDFERGSVLPQADLSTWRYDAEISRCRTQMRRWRVRFEELLESTPNVAATLPVATLRMWHGAGTIVAEAGCYGSELRWDAYDDVFRELVECAEIIVEETRRTAHWASFSVEMGYVNPAFVAATRCRNPGIRRRAIAVMLAVARQEGIWQSTGAAAIAQRWVDVEEEGLIDITCSANVPELQRIATVSTMVHVDSQTGHLDFFLADGTRRHETVCWGPMKSLVRTSFS